jgi:hypothetical protein
MAIVKTGGYNGFQTVLGGAAQNLNLGFIPSRFKAINHTIIASGTGVGAFEWYNNMPDASAYITTYTAGAPVVTYITTNGVTRFQTSDASMWTPTNLTITGISKAANASITATHAFTSDDIGVTTVTFSGIKGMTQMNTLRGVIQSVTSTTSFTVNINSTSFTTYSSGGIANVITGVPAKTLYSNPIPFTVAAGNVAAWAPTGLPGGDGQWLNTAQANNGVIGLTFGTTLMVTTDDLWRFEAYLDAPFTS